MFNQRLPWYNNSYTKVDELRFNNNMFYILLFLFIMFSSSNLFLTLVHTENVISSRNFDYLTPNINYYYSELPDSLTRIYANSPIFFRADGSLLVIEISQTGAPNPYLKHIVNGTVKIYGKGLLTSDNISVRNWSTSSLGNFISHPLSGELTILDLTNKKIRTLRDNNDILATIASFDSSSISLFTMDSTAKLIYLVDSNTNMKLLDLSSGTTTTILGLSVNNALKGYYEGIPAVNAKMQTKIISILYNDGEIIISNSSSISKINKQGIFWTLAGAYTSCSFNASTTLMANKTCLKSPQLIQYIDDELYFLDNLILIRKIAKDGRVLPVLRLPYEAISVSRNGTDWWITRREMLEKCDENGGNYTKMYGRLFTLVTNPQYSVYTYGAQQSQIIGMTRNGNYIMPGSNSLALMNRKSGFLTELVKNWPTFISLPFAMDHSNDDIYFSDYNSKQIFRYIWKQKQVEVFAGSVTNCVQYQPYSDARDICLTSFGSLRVFNGSVYLAESYLKVILKIDISSKITTSYFGIGNRCGQGNCISNLNGQLVASSFLESISISESKSGEIFGSSGKIIFKLNSFSANEILQHLYGENVYSSSRTVSSLTVSSVTGELYYYKCVEQGISCSATLYKSGNGQEIQISPLSDTSGGLVINSNSSKLYFSGDNNAVYEFDLQTYNQTLFVKGTAGTKYGICITSNDRYVIYITKTQLSLIDMKTRNETVYSLPSSINRFTGIYCNTNGSVYISGYNNTLSVQVFNKFNITSRIYTLLSGMTVSSLLQLLL